MMVKIYLFYQISSMSINMCMKPEILIVII